MSGPYTNIQGKVYSSETSGVELPRLSANNTFTGANQTFSAITATSGTFSATLTSPNIQDSSTSATATVLGDGTGSLGTIGTYSFVAVTSANAAHIITLPNPVAGRVVRLFVGSNGFEMATTAPAVFTINAGTGASSTIAANSYVECRAASATQWICNRYATDGTASAVEASHG